MYIHIYFHRHFGIALAKWFRMKLMGLLLRRLPVRHLIELKQCWTQQRCVVNVFLKSTIIAILSICCIRKLCAFIFLNLSILKDTICTHMLFHFSIMHLYMYMQAHFKAGQTDLKYQKSNGFEECPHCFSP